MTPDTARVIGAIAGNNVAGFAAGFGWAVATAAESDIAGSEKTSTAPANAGGKKRREWFMHGCSVKTRALSSARWTR